MRLDNQDRAGVLGTASLFAGLCMIHSVGLALLVLGGMILSLSLYGRCRRPPTPPTPNIM